MKFRLNAVGLGLSVLLAACGGGGGSNNSGDPVATTSSGQAVDGYIFGGNASCGGATTITNETGYFAFSPACAAAIEVNGGINFDTKLPFKGLLKAPAGSPFVTPLTTLIVDGGLTNAEIAAAFSLSAGTDVSKIDPISNLELHKRTLAAHQIAQQVADILGGLASTATAPTSAADVQAIYTEAVKAVASTIKANANAPLFDATGAVNATLLNRMVQQSLINASTSSNAALVSISQILSTFSPTSVADATAQAIASQAQAFMDLPAGTTPGQITSLTTALQSNASIANVTSQLTNLLTNAAAATGQINLAAVGAAIRQISDATTNGDTAALASAVAGANNAIAIQAAAAGVIAPVITGPIAPPVAPPVNPPEVPPVVVPPVTPPVNPPVEPPANPPEVPPVTPPVNPPVEPPEVPPVVVPPVTPPANPPVEPPEVPPVVVPPVTPPVNPPPVEPPVNPPVTPPTEPILSISLDQTPGSASAPTTYSAGGTQATYNDDTNTASYARISGFGANDAIAFAGAVQSHVAVSSQGSNVTLTVNNNGVVSSIVLQGIINAGQIVYDVASFNTLPVGDIRFNGQEQAQNTTLDGLGGTLTNPATTDASSGSFVFTDDALLPSVVRISGFGANDSLRLTNTSASAVSVSSKGGNASFTVNQNGTISSITLLGVVPSGGIVYDINSFNALPVGNVQFQ